MVENIVAIVLFGVFFLANGLLLGRCMALSIHTTQQINALEEVNLD